MRWRSYDAISGHTIFLEEKNKSRLLTYAARLYILLLLLPGLIIISYYEIRNNDGGVVIKTDGRRFLLLCNWGRRCLEVYCVYLPNQRKEMEQKIKSWLRIRNYMCWITQDYKLFNKKRLFKGIELPLLAGAASPATAAFKEEITYQNSYQIQFPSLPLPLKKKLQM